MFSDDYYETLGITRDATDKEIRQAYRRMIKRYHPDLNPDLPDAESCLRAVVIAYETLGNKRKRADYDRITSLFGPRRKPPVSTDQKTGSTRQRPMSTLEQRNREARRPLLVWLVIMILLMTTYLVLMSYSSGRFWGRLRISPVIYGQSFATQSSVYESFKKEPVEDRWYLWYRNSNYNLLMGEMGSARELAVAYTEIARLAESRGDLMTAQRYITAAVGIDPGYAEAVKLEISLQQRIKRPSEH